MIALWYHCFGHLFGTAVCGFNDNGCLILVRVVCAPAVFCFRGTVFFLFSFVARIDYFNCGIAVWVSGPFGICHCDLVLARVKLQVTRWRLCITWLLSKCALWMRLLLGAAIHAQHQNTHKNDLPL